MLMVTDLIEIARSGASGSELLARAPARFSPDTRRAPVVVWNVCRQCNQSCPHCYAAASKRPSPTDLTTDEALGVVDQLADAGVRFLIFSGGEPLLRADLLDLIRRATERGISAQLSTNGTLLDRRTAHEIAEAGVRYVGISIDGIPQFNDAYRGMIGGYHRAALGLLHAQEAGVRTGLRMTITRRNARQLDAMLSRTLVLGVGRFYVSHLVYAGRGKHLMGDDLAPAESRALLEKLFERADALLDQERELRVVTGGNDSDGGLLLLWVRERYGEEAAVRVRRVLERRGGNSAGEGVVCIDDRGRVHPDQFWQSAVLGNVREQPFAEVLDHPLVGELRDRASRLEGRCQSCPFLSVCRGSHRERALARHGNPWAPDPSCVLTDEDLGAARMTEGGVA